jgi:uncharacterized membrane protein YfcA
LEFLIVALSALLVSGLTLFSGFGLGTLLMPVFALFFPVEVAIAATAIVHGANNVLKVALFGKMADFDLVLRFGLPAMLAASAGAAALGLLSGLPPLFSYSLGSHTPQVTPIELLMSLVMVFFALVELHPRLRHLEFERRFLVFGGLLSGFFGGLSGHQGALRSAFLAKVGISTQAFVGTNAVIGLAVDLVRLVVYGLLFRAGSVAIADSQLAPLVFTGVLAAFCGVLAGKRLLSKVTMGTVQTLTGVMLLGIALALGAGLL